MNFEFDFIVFCLTLVALVAISSNKDQIVLRAIDTLSELSRSSIRLVISLQDFIQAQHQKGQQDIESEKTEEQVA